MTILKKIFTKLRRYPDSLVFFVTDSCNLKCKHCFLDKKSPSKIKDLDLSEISRIAKGLRGFRNLIITGGEPFLRNDLADICNLFHSKKRVLRICTNGTLPFRMQDALKRISGFKSITVQISLEGPKEINDAIRGYGHFDQVIDTLSRIKNYNIEIACTLNKYNVSKALYLLKLGYPVIFIPMQWKQGNNTLIFPPLEELDKIYAETKGKISLRNRLILKHAIKNMRDKKRSLKCFAGSVDAVLYANGNVGLCEMTEPIGNITDYDYRFIKVWKSPKAQKMRKSIKNCYCVNACNLSTSIAISYDLPHNPRL